MGDSVRQQFNCLMVRKDDLVTCGVESIALGDLPEGEVLIQVKRSSLNYKDALACRAHPGVVQTLPHVPGIDCAGYVVESSSPDYKSGDAVLVTGYELGTSHWGGYSAYVRVPADWVVPLPQALSIEEAMVLGTAGFTAAQCVMALQHHGLSAGKGAVAVTGATGGVGSIAVCILGKLGYQVDAITGKSEQADFLKSLGAAQVLPRETLEDDENKPLRSTPWIGAVDTVGGKPLATLLASISHRGCVAACGLAAGHKLEATVYPFILRGITLAGIDSAKCPRDSRLQVWERLSEDWKLDSLNKIARTVALRDLPQEVDKMLAGKSLGRVLVDPS